MATKPKAQAAKQEVAARGPSAVAGRKIGGEVVPEHIKQGLARGNENVQMGDIVIPRLEIVQALSPCLKKSEPAYIADAEQGDMFNSVTRRLYGSKTTICPVIFRKEFLVWKDRAHGGGFRGAFPNVEQAAARIGQEEEPKYFAAVETAQHFCLLVDEESGETEEIVLSMAKTKLKVSRSWNALIRINGADRFSRIYNVFTIEDSNDKGEFNNFGVQTLGFAPLEIYRRAEALYNNIQAGTTRVVADTTQDDESVVGEQGARTEY